GLRRPCFGVLVAVLAHNRRHLLVEERQVEVFDVNKFKFGVTAILRDLVNPFGHSLALAAGPGASNDDGNSKHKFLPYSRLQKLYRYRISAKRFIVRLRRPHATTPVTIKRVIAD